MFGPSFKSLSFPLLFVSKYVPVWNGTVPLRLVISEIAHNARTMEDADVLSELFRVP